MYVHELFWLSAVFMCQTVLPWIALGNVSLLDFKNWDQMRAKFASSMSKRTQDGPDSVPRTVSCLALGLFLVQEDGLIVRSTNYVLRKAPLNFLFPLLSSSAIMKTLQSCLLSSPKCTLLVTRIFF